MLNMLSYLLMGGTYTLFALLMLVLRLPIVCLSLSLHESSHGYIAYKMGDPTARNLGRITLNPTKHFSVLGTVSMIFLGIGWAKPVPINTRYFKKPKKGMAWTAAAGPLSNLCLAIISILLMRIFDIVFLGGNFYAPLFGGYSYSDLIPYFLFESNYTLAEKLKLVWLFFLEMLGFLNISLAIFNLIPIPPFDGSRIAYVLLPDKYYFGIMKYESIIMMIFIFLFYRFGSGFALIVDWIYNGIYSFFALITGFMV